MNPDIPIFGIITRLADQKGVSELFGPAYGSVHRICSEIKLQMVVLGAGELWCENELSRAQPHASKFPRVHRL